MSWLRKFHTSVLILLLIVVVVTHLISCRDSRTGTFFHRLPDSKEYEWSKVTYPHFQYELKSKDYGIVQIADHKPYDSFSEYADYVEFQWKKWRVIVRGNSFVAPLQTEKIQSLPVEDLKSIRLSHDGIVAQARRLFYFCVTTKRE